MPQLAAAPGKASQSAQAPVVSAAAAGANADATRADADATRADADATRTKGISTPVPKSAIAPAAPLTGPGTAASASRPPASVSADATLAQQISALPKLDAAGIDVDTRGAQLLAHLNAVLRYYRTEYTQVQKIGEPSDVLYSQQAILQATQVAQYAFQSARNLAALLARLGPPAGPQTGAQTGAQTGTQTGAQTGAQAGPGADTAGEPTESQKLNQVRTTVLARIAQLSAQDAALDKQISTTRGKALPALRQQDEQLEGQLELQKAMLEGLGKISTMAGAQTSQGLLGEIDRLQHTAPQLAVSASKVNPSPMLDSLNSALDSGVSTQAIVLFQLLSTRHTVDDRIRETDDLRRQADDMRTPLIKLLRSTVQQGDAAMQGAPDPKATDADTLAATRKRYDTLTSTFRVLSAATLPLNQEIVGLEQSRANLLSWRTAVDAEYATVVRHLLLRVLLIAGALLILVITGQVWQRLTVRYVHDLRRRRQLLIVRRIVLGFFTGLVVIFGFVTQFSSLATFAGFITAGIAVGLQTILLSVAAYFFIVGRFGVRVGDRITVAGVTGDVVDVGLVRFYMLELTGTGTELHPTGRVAVFANSVLFQAGTPLYKQMPGTEYAWHELTVKLNPDTDYRAATEAALLAVETVYGEYKDRIEDQHRTVEGWMDAVVEAPHIEPRFQMATTGLQYAVLFPVQIKDAATTDEKIVHMLLNDMSSKPTVKDAIAATPAITAVIKG